MPNKQKLPVSKAQKKATARYNITAYDRIEMKIPKGKKDIIKEHAEKFQPEIGEKWRTVDPLPSHYIKICTVFFRFFKRFDYANIIPKRKNAEWTIYAAWLNASHTRMTITGIP